jgi:hypothetical protein
MLADCATVSAMFCSYEGDGKVAKTEGKVPGLRSITDVRGRYVFRRKKRSKMKFEYAKA